MKKIILSLCSVLMLACCFMSGTVFADSEKSPVYADKINDGTYSIEVTSSSSMFKIVDCQLTVANGTMTAVMTLSGTGYEKLFMGTGEEAESAPDDNCIYFVENTEGKYTYNVPVEALDNNIDCAAWSIKKQKWYDRTIVFESATLPDGALKGGINMVVIIIIAAAAAVVVTAAVVVVRLRKKKTD